MTFRRDPLDVRVVVRQSARRDHLIEAPVRPGLQATRAESAALPASRSAYLGAVDPAKQTRRLAVPPTTSGGGGPGVVLVKTGFRQVATRVREIVFVEASRNYVRIHLESGAVLKTRVPLERLARHLGSGGFTRAHRGAVVNIEHVRTATALAGGRLALTLTGGATVMVSRDRRRLVLAEIGVPASDRD